MKLKNFKKSILESVKLYNKQEPVSTIDNDLVPTVNNIEYQNAKKSKEKAKEREDELKPNIEAADELAKKEGNLKESKDDKVPITSLKKGDKFIYRNDICQIHSTDNKRNVDIELPNGKILGVSPIVRVIKVDNSKKLQPLDAVREFEPIKEGVNKTVKFGINDKKLKEFNDYISKIGFKAKETGRKDDTTDVFASYTEVEVSGDAFSSAWDKLEKDVKSHFASPVSNSKLEDYVNQDDLKKAVKNAFGYEGQDAQNAINKMDDKTKQDLIKKDKEKNTSTTTTQQSSNLNESLEDDVKKEVAITSEWLKTWNDKFDDLYCRIRKDKVYYKHSDGLEIFTFDKFDDFFRDQVVEVIWTEDLSKENLDALHSLGLKTRDEKDEKGVSEKMDSKISNCKKESCNKKPHVLKEAKQIDSDIGSYFNYSGDFDFLEIVQDVVDRVTEDVKDGSDLDDVIFDEIDSVLIYYSDQWTIMKHYQNPSEADLDAAIEELYDDVYAICSKRPIESEEEEEEEESLKEGHDEHGEKCNCPECKTERRLAKKEDCKKEPIKEASGSGGIEYQIAKSPKGVEVEGEGHFKSTRNYTHELTTLTVSGYGTGDGDYRWMNRPWQRFTFESSLYEAGTEIGLPKELLDKAKKETHSLETWVDYIAAHIDEYSKEESLKEEKKSCNCKEEKCKDKKEKQLDKRFERKAEKPLKEASDTSINEVANFIKDSVESLKDGSSTNNRLKLDDKLAIFVGWSDGYAEDDETVIHNEDKPSYAINAGIKVWTSDDMWTDFDFLNFAHHKNGDIEDISLSIGLDDAKDGYKSVAKWLLDEYESIKDLKIDEKGLIIEESLKEKKDETCSKKEECKDKKEIKESIDTKKEVKKPIIKRKINESLKDDLDVEPVWNDIICK